MTSRMPAVRTSSTSAGTSRPAETTPGAGEVAWATAGRAVGTPGVVQPAPAKAATRTAMCNDFMEGPRAAVEDVVREDASKRRRHQSDLQIYLVISKLVTSTFIIKPSRG